MSNDRFGNSIDPAVGYARGSILAGSADEVRRLTQAGRVAADFVAQQGADKIAICTGNLRDYQVSAEDLKGLCEEWVGPGLFGEQLRQTTIAHLGGKGDEIVAAINRTSAGIIATILAHAKGQLVISLVPTGDRSHASVGRGAKLAQVAVQEVYDLAGLQQALAASPCRLLIVTTVTSELAMLADELVTQATRVAQAAGCIVFLDEAYGARYRPVLYGGKQALEFGADLVITNADKAGLSGPRAGVLCGHANAVIPVQAKASELGMEARAPIAVGILRSLQGFTPGLLKQEVEDGKALSQALSALVGEQWVAASALGPKIDEQDVQTLILQMAQRADCPWVPAEICAAVGMLMLADKGVVTVNTHGQPGGRVSLRLKPTSGAISRVGGAQALAQCVYDAMQKVAKHLEDKVWFRQLIVGGG